jgi:Biotin-protein ligase, N terminal
MIPSAGFVRVDGGAYLGLCAGAYYASAHVDFEAGTRCHAISCALQVCIRHDRPDARQHNVASVVPRALCLRY